MLTTTGGYGGFSVDDLDAAEAFYRDALGLQVTRIPQGLDLHLASGATVFVYPKPDHRPATYTTLYLEVADIDAAADELATAGVEFERYDDGFQDEKGIARGRSAGQGPDIAWFLDPAKNIIAIARG